MSAVFSGCWITYVVILALVILLTIFAATLLLKTGMSYTVVKTQMTCCVSGKLSSYMLLKFMPLYEESGSSQKDAHGLLQS